MTMTTTEKSTSKKSKNESVLPVRRGIQIFFLLLTFAIGLRHIMPGGPSRGGAIDSFCPFGGVETLFVYITTGQTLQTTSLMNFSVLLAVMGLTLVAGRAFCGWMCPLGTLQDALARLARRLTGEQKHVLGKRGKHLFPMTIPVQVDRWLNSIKYVILIAVVIFSMQSVYPPLHDMCVVRAIFSFHLPTTVLWVVTVAFVLSSMFAKRLFCRYLCPMGALMAVFNKISIIRLKVNQEKCNQCSRCDVECPMDIPAVSQNIRSVECVRCLACVDTCADPETITLRMG